MVANISQNKWNSTLPMIAGVTWVVGLGSSTFYAFSKGFGGDQLESANNIALKITKIAVLTEIATVGLATIVTAGRAIRAGMATGFSFFCREITKSISPCKTNDDPDSPRCNMGEPEALLCNTLCPPATWILANRDCWESPRWNVCCPRPAAEQPDGAGLDGVAIEEVPLEGAPNPLEREPTPPADGEPPPR